MAAFNKFNSFVEAITLKKHNLGTDTFRKLAATVGTFAETGNATGLIAGRKLAATVGTFSFTGNAAGLTYTPAGGYTYTLTASAGAFAVTGQGAATGAP